MQTDDIQNEEEELLSETCRRLAARLADLIHRTMNLYERDLAIAEATPPTNQNQDCGSKKCRAGAPAGQTQILAERPPRNTEMRKSRASSPCSLKSLVHTMETLLRCAKLARELEEHDSQHNGAPTEFTDDELRDIYDGDPPEYLLADPETHRRLRAERNQNQLEPEITPTPDQPPP